MPIYEYRCQNCGAEFEEWQRITEPPTCSCKRCGGKASRLISQSTFVLKGSGWYVTDYGKGSQSAPPSKKHNSGSDSGTSAAKESASESKPSASDTKS